VDKLSAADDIIDSFVGSVLDWIQQLKVVP